MQEGAQRTAHLFEVMNGLDTVKGMGADAWARRKWEMLTVKISESTLRMREWSAFGSNFAIMMTGLSTVLLVMVGALLIADGKLSLGQLIAVSMLSSRALAPASQLAGLILRSQQVKMSLEALDKIMISPIDEHSGALHMPTLEGGSSFATCTLPTPIRRRCSRASTCASPRAKRSVSSAASVRARAR